MTVSRSMRFALCVLRHLGVHNESLVGDLIEEYGTRRSQLWLWRQVAGAVLARPEPRSHTGPLGLDQAHTVRSASRKLASRERPLVDLSCGRRRTAPASREPAFRERPRIDLSGGPVPGIGGLTTLALVFQVTLVSPQLLWLPVFGLVGGGLVSFALVVRHRREPYRTASASPLTLSGLR